MGRSRHFEIRKVDHVGFAVASLDAAISFFVDGLGGTLARVGVVESDFLTRVTGAPNASAKVAIVEVGGQRIELLEYEGAARNGDARRPYDAGSAHLAFIVEDIEAVLSHVDGFGWKAQGTPPTVASGPRAGAKMMYVVGPSGETIEFIQLGTPG